MGYCALGDHGVLKLRGLGVNLGWKDLAAGQRDRFSQVQRAQRLSLTYLRSLYSITAAQAKTRRVPRATRWYSSLIPTSFSFSSSSSTTGFVTRMHLCGIALVLLSYVYSNLRNRDQRAVAWQSSLSYLSGATSTKENLVQYDKETKWREQKKVRVNVKFVAYFLNSIMFACGWCCRSFIFLLEYRGVRT